jgi:YegS/Rv2252/BmrU family lipid kinase
MDVLLIVNPISGDKNKSSFLEFARRLMSQHKLDNHVYKTTGKADFKEVEQLIKTKSPRKVIVVGGDGTLNMFLDIFRSESSLIGFIPMGSANGMAEEFDLIDSPNQLFENYLASENYFEVDLLLLNQKYLLLHIGDLGANANLVWNYEKDKSRGLLTYAKHFWSEFKNLKGFEFEIETEKNTYERKGVMLAICNGRKFGTGIALNIIGKMNDGLFELVIIEAVEFSDLIKATYSKFDEDYEIQNFEIIQAKSAQIKLRKPNLLQIDGEIVDQFDNIQIDVLPKALKFIK